MDLTAQCASLANDFGATKGPNAAVSFWVELWVGSPDAGGHQMPSTTTVVDDDTDVESTVPNGYARAVLANNGTNFPAADPTTGVLETPPVEGFPTSTAEYPDSATHWVLRDTATDAIWQWAAFPADAQITISDAGVRPRPSLSIFYNPFHDLTGDR